MQKFILLTLVIGLGFFLYLLKTNQISQNDFSINKLKPETRFEIRKNPTDSDIYAVIGKNEYKVFTFSGDDFKKLLKAEYALNKYKVPFEAKDAVTGTWIGNRYVFYMLEKLSLETGKKTYEIYKAEYSTDDVSKLQYYLIKSIEQSETDNSTEVRY